MNLSNECVPSEFERPASTQGPNTVTIAVAPYTITEEDYEDDEEAHALVFSWPMSSASAVPKSSKPAVKATRNVKPDERKGPKAEDKLRTQKIKPSVTNGKGGGKGSRIKLAYHIFCAQARLDVNEIHPDASFGDKNKVLGAMWASLDERAKAVYQKAADEQNAAATAIAEAKA